MMFCKKCGSMMMPSEKRGKKMFNCTCGFSVEGGTGTLTVKEQGSTTEPAIEVVEIKNLNPLIDAVCPKCKHGRAHYWVVQTRSADEPPTRFFKCEKCGHSWREK